MPLSANLRMAVLLSGPCAYCGDPIPTQVDHVLPVSRGGKNNWDNLAPACKRCNMEKLDFTPEEYRAYREEEGLGWPPQSGYDFLRELLVRLQERYPGVDVRAAIRKSLSQRTVIRKRG